MTGRMAVKIFTTIKITSLKLAGAAIVMIGENTDKIKEGSGFYY